MVVVHERLLQVEVWRQVVLVKLHVRRDHLERGKVEAADSAAVHEGTSVCLQVADHGGTPAEEAQAHLTLVGLLSSVNAQVVGELAGVCKALATVPAAVPLLFEHRCSRGGAQRTSILQESSREWHAPLNHFVWHAEPYP